jgi:hypothetical protein
MKSGGAGQIRFLRIIKQINIAVIAMIGSANKIFSETTTGTSMYFNKISCSVPIYPCIPLTKISPFELTLTLNPTLFDMFFQAVFHRSVPLLSYFNKMAPSPIPVIKILLFSVVIALPSSPRNEVPLLHVLYH